MAQKCRGGIWRGRGLKRASNQQALMRTLLINILAGPELSNHHLVSEKRASKQAQGKWEVNNNTKHGVESQQKKKWVEEKVWQWRTLRIFLQMMSRFNTQTDRHAHRHTYATNNGRNACCWLVEARQKLNSGDFPIVLNQWDGRMLPAHDSPRQRGRCFPFDALEPRGLFHPPSC